MSRPAGREPLVTVIVPTHDHASTLDLALDSVLAQTVTELDVVVIGDGASDEVVAVLDRYRADPRVRTVLRPKSPSRAEEVRHEILSASTAPFVAYLGDDDLMLPDHLATMMELLGDADFAHPLPMAIGPDGEPLLHPTDLSLAQCRDWHQHPQRNCVSLSGVVHRLAAYRRLPAGWRTTPPGIWSDHYMWQQWFATPGLRYRTGQRLTILKFDAAWRRDLTPEQRRDELLSWCERAAAPGFAAELAAIAAAATWRFAVRTTLELSQVQDELQRQFAISAELPVARGQLTDAAAALSAARIELAAAQDQLATARRQLATAQDQLTTVVRERDAAIEERIVMAATKTWRLHERVSRWAPVRVLLGRRRA